MPTLKFNLSEAEIEELSYQRHAYPDPLVQKRIYAVYLKATLGWNNSMIGQTVGLHYNAVGKWINTYKKNGFESLLSNNYGSKKSELENHADSILKSFQIQPPMTSLEAAGRIRKMTGINRSGQQVRAFMKRHELKFLKCDHIPAKADNDKQHQWVETELKPVIEVAQKEEVHLFFAMQHILYYSHFFVLCGVRFAFLSRLPQVGIEVITLSNTTYITSATLIDFLKLLKEKYADKPIAIVLDNARYQHCFLVATFAKSLGIHLLFLPPYCPNLNIIERLWKFTKKEILYGKYYAKPKLFHQAIQNFFDQINQTFKSELSTLLTLKFQFFDDKDSLIYTLNTI